MQFVYPLMLFLLFMIGIPYYADFVIFDWYTPLVLL